MTGPCVGLEIFKCISVFSVCLFFSVLRMIQLHSHCLKRLLMAIIRIYNQMKRVIDFKLNFLCWESCLDLALLGSALISLHTVNALYNVHPEVQTCSRRQNI